MTDFNLPTFSPVPAFSLTHRAADAIAISLDAAHIRHLASMERRGVAKGFEDGADFSAYLRARIDTRRAGKEMPTRESWQSGEFRAAEMMAQIESAFRAAGVEF